jgi:gliding motility-associated-like protein
MMLLLFFAANKLSAQKTDSLRCDSFLLPNAVTPNCENYNCDFVPQFICGVPKRYEMYVFDRWGNMVFSTTTATKGWDGRNEKNQQFCEMGVYAYLIKYSYQSDGKLNERKGSTTLIR